MSYTKQSVYAINIPEDVFQAALRLRYQKIYYWPGILGGQQRDPQRANLESEGHTPASNVPARILPSLLFLASEFQVLQLPVS